MAETSVRAAGSPRVDHGTVIEARGLGKAYHIFARPEDRLKQALLGWRKRYYHEFWALRGVDLELRRGETVGIVGRNGSGKSTLLQMIVGTLKPTEGELRVTGRVAALLELGTGFNPDFTGRENVFMNGQILGIGQAEMEANFDRIAAFADIGEHLDQPVRTYSSGMTARLAFAVAVHVDPDILVVDEALSVGDEAFQRKCFARIREIRDKGATVLFVSHGAATIIELCDRAVLLDHGTRLLTGKPKLVMAKYQRLAYAPAEMIETIRGEIRAIDANGGEEAKEGGAGESVEKGSAGAEETAAEAGGTGHFDPGLTPKSRVDYATRGAAISEPVILDSHGRRVNVLVPGLVYRYQYAVTFEQPASFVRFGMMIKNVKGTEVAGAASHAAGQGVGYVAAGQEVVVTFEFRNLLNAGTYFLNAGVLGSGSEGGEEWLHRVLDAAMFRVDPVAGWLPTGLVNVMTETPCRIRVLDTLRAGARE